MSAPDEILAKSTDSPLPPPSFSPCHSLDLGIAYELPHRKISRLLIVPTGTTDSGYDSVETIKADHMGTYGLEDFGAHIYLAENGEIDWGLSLNKAPLFPAAAQKDDLVILVFGTETSFSAATLATLRALLPVINAVHGNTLIFAGLERHHSRLGIGKGGKLIAPALQEPLAL